MEGKKVLVLEVVALMLLTSLLVASARQPLAALRLLGKRPVPESELVCCDSCNCPEEGGCVCDDAMGGDCADGCLTCTCADGIGQGCRCLDVLSTCPDACDSDYIIDNSPARNKPGACGSH